MKKKLLTLLLAGVMAFSVSACTSNKKGADETVTLTWYVNSNPLSDMSLVMEKVNEITEKKIGVKVDMKTIDHGAYEERMRLYMATDKEWDLCYSYDINFYLQAIRNGSYYDLTELYKKSEKLNDFIPQFAVDTALVDGKLYGVPNVQCYMFTYGMYLRKDIAERYGLDKITKVSSADELEPYFDKMLVDYPDMYPVNNVFENDLMQENYYRINNYASVPKNSKENKIVNFFETPEYEQLLQRGNRWYKKGYVRKDLIVAAENMEADMKAGKYCATISSLSPGSLANYEAHYGREVVFIQCAEPVTSSDAILNTITAVNANTKYPEKAMALLELVNTDKELLNLMQFGIEGKHYEKVADNTIRFINREAYGIDAYKFANALGGYLVEGQPEDYCEQVIKLNEESQKPPFLGFTVNTDDFKSSYAQCEAVRQEYAANTLYANDNYKIPYEKMKSRLKDAGVDEIISGIQTQLDEWWANNK